jgi:hypothetical protein
MATATRFVVGGVGPSIWNEINTVDDGSLKGKAITIEYPGADSLITFQWSLNPEGQELSVANIETLDYILESHDKNAPYVANDNGELCSQVEDEALRMKNVPKQLRFREDKSYLLDRLNTIINGGV